MMENNLFNFWSHIYNNLSYWRACDIILTCPATHQGAINFFHEDQLYLLHKFSDLNIFLSKYSRRKLNSIGILSPQILKKLMKASFLEFVHLKQLCSTSLVIVRNNLPSPKIDDCLTLLHEIGFYHVLTLFNQDKMSFLSQEILVGKNIDGYASYFYLATLPGILTNSDCYTTHVAYRLSCMISHYPWVKAVGHIEYLESGYFRGLPQQPAISSTCVKSDSSNISVIKATFSWNRLTTTGNVALISCYQGPTDSNMYAFMFRGDNWNHLSIWKSDEKCQWTTLGTATVDMSNYSISSSGIYRASLWLKTTPTQLVGGIGEKVILTVEDFSLVRNQEVGVRFCSDQLLLSNIEAFAGE